MRIVAVREKTVALAAPLRNASISFAAMTASALAIVTDVIRDGRPVVGLAFDSIGRYGHGGLLRERFLPRLMAAHPDDYADEARGMIDPLKIWSIVMRDEKPGGHGERPGAVGLIDAAVWDLAAKLEQKPLWRLLAERFGDGAAEPHVAVYASGGHYLPGDDLAALQDEMKRYLDQGFRRVKIKIGGTPLDHDRRRIEAALSILGSGAALAVDCNGTFPRERARDTFLAVAPYELAWIEEPVDPLDYALHAELAAAFPTPIGTGENLFSAADARNLLRYGGLRPDRDLLQMDISHSYGIPEYLRILALMEEQGWSRRRCWPHAGHLLALQVVAGLGLGGHEAAPDASSLYGGFAAGVSLADGQITPGDAPGVGIERKDNLYAVFRDLLD
ncbi:MAG TPA: enolase C-terminal domain-like protein [Stellaceae bacterium]|nr:enolase C-terminal domain-like protein [Stellaceae bacterium]